MMTAEQLQTLLKIQNKVIEEQRQLIAMMKAQQAWKSIMEHQRIS